MSDFPNIKIIIDIADINYRTGKGFVADPFLVKNEHIYVFFEILYEEPREKFIGCARKRDLLNWEYIGAAIQKPKYEYSFPYVFKYDSEIYLLPEISHVNNNKTQLILYRSDDFPLQWTKTTEYNIQGADCRICQRFRRYYLPDRRRGEMKLEQDDVDRICKRVVDHDMDTQFVADQFEISRRRVQQLAKAYRESGEIPTLDTPGRRSYAEYPTDLEARILEIYQSLNLGAEAVSHVLRVRDGISIDTNRVHTILEEYEHVTENPNKQGRRRPWVRFERDYAGVTVHMDWYRNDRGDHVLGVEDDASRFLFDMIETDASSAAASVDLLDSVREEYETEVPILEVITDHGSEFVNPRQDERPCLDHDFERYLHEHDIRHSLCSVGRPQSNGKIERFFQTYEKQRWRFDSLQAFLDFYNKERPHMSLNWDELETPYEAFNRLRPHPQADIPDLFATEVSTDE